MQNVVCFTVQTLVVREIKAFEFKAYQRCADGVKNLFVGGGTATTPPIPGGKGDVSFIIADACLLNLSRLTCGACVLFIGGESW